MSELKPCPFCGGEAELHEYDNQFSEVVYIISCSKCNCKMELNHESRLVYIWNTRTQSQCERVKQLELALRKLEVGSCKCLTKTNVYQYHAEFCPKRIIGEALDQLPPKEQGQ